MFSLCYLPTAGRLTITVIKARNLKAMDITGASGGAVSTAALLPRFSRVPCESPAEKTWWTLAPKRPGFHART